MASDFPYFNFWVKDFLGDNRVLVMTAEEIGGYLLLLLAAWQEAPPATLPADETVLCRLARMSSDRWQDCRGRILSCFSASRDGKRLTQKRLQMEYRRLESLGKTRSEKASAAASARWHKGKTSMLGAMPEHSPSNAPGCQPDSDPEINTQPSYEGSATSVAGAPRGGAEPKKPPRKPATGAHANAIAEFVSAWRKRYACKYPFNGGKDGAAVQWMLGQIDGDLDRWREIVGRYLADEDDFAVTKRHSLGWLRSQFPQYLVAAPRPQTKRKGVPDGASKQYDPNRDGDAGSVPANPAENADTGLF